MHRSRRPIYVACGTAFALGLGAAGLAAPTGAQAGNAAPADWKYQRKVVLDTSATGANVAGNVKGFPVPVQLDASTFDFTQARPDGADLRFTDPAGAFLPYQIESWDAAAKKAAVWVRTDVRGNSATQSITMLWGNPAARSESDGTKVFAKADGWISAHHLAEKGSTAAGGYQDATANAAHGRGVNISGTATGPGRVGPAVRLDRGKQEYILVDGSQASPLYNPLPAKGTFSIWSNARSHPAAYIAMFAKGESGFRIHYFGSGAQTEPCIDVASYDWCPLPSGAFTRVENNRWYHFVFVLDKPRSWYYINGKLEVTATDTNAWKTTGTEPVTIGNNEKTPGRNERKRSFDGLLDEARIMSAPRDAHWAKLDYESQKAGSTFVRLAPGR
jgi:hypothetical protein